MLHWEKANAVVSNANTILINYHMKEWCVIIQCDRGDADNFFFLDEYGRCVSSGTEIFCAIDYVTNGWSRSWPVSISVLLTLLPWPLFSLSIKLSNFLRLYKIFILLIVLYYILGRYVKFKLIIEMIDCWSIDFSITSMYNNFILLSNLLVLHFFSVKFYLCY